ncbi:reverse transcriptase domain-containing protein [Tanacetum coccineum]
MVQPWHRMTRQKVTQSFARVSKITFPPLTTTKGTEGPLVIEAKIGRHMIHHMYVDEGSSTKVLYEHCFNRRRPEIKNQMVPTTTSLTSFSGETIWPLGQLRLLVTIGDADHSTKAWMNFMIVSTILILAKCATVTTSSKKILKEAEVRHENLKVALHPNFLDQEVAIGGTLSAKERTKLCSVLKENLDIFAWQPANMTGVPRSVAEHWLNIREGYSPVRQKKRGQAPERAKSIQAEVQKLVEAGIVREVYYHDWLSNPVMVKKHDGNWRMCVDFTDLNKACPQDCYPLPKIDWKVESLCGYPFKYFFDAYKGYHQNAGATYQRLVDKAFDSQVGQNIEVYVDDLVIKSHTEAEMLRDIDETFRTLRKINMKLNPKKYTFGIVEGMFLGYMISPEGIKPCPDKTKAVLQLLSPRTIKEVQSLNGKLASLNRFLSKSSEKSLPLFKTLKKCIKKSDFHWTPEAEQAFKQLKQHLSELPLLVAPKPKEELIVYLSASHGAISSLFCKPCIAGPRTKLYPNGKASPSTGFRSQAVTKIFPSAPYRSYHRPTHQTNNITPRCGRAITKIERYAGRTQYYVPAKDIRERTDFSRFPCREAGRSTTRYVSGRNPTRAVDIIHGRINMCRWIRFQFTASNNEAEYEALIAGLRIAAQMGVRNVHVRVDSKLVANQVQGTYVAKEDNMVKYLEKAKSLISGFANFSISQVPRSKNKKADALSKIASTSFAHLSKQVLVEVLKEKSIQEEEVATVVEEEGPT